ncbi:MAG: type 4a pilus biogenesis protein PilO [Terriglobales bacterium]
MAIVVVALVAISGGLYWFVYQDMDNHNRQQRATLKAKQDENDALRPYADKKADMERRIATLQDQLEQMKRIVPDEKEAPQFMEMMQAEARKAGVEIRRYEARPVATQEFFTEVPWDIDIDGPYYSVLRFFENVAHLDRIVNVANLRMAGVKEPGTAGVRATYQYAPTESVVVNCLTTTFFSREPQATTPAAPVKK